MKPRTKKKIKSMLCEWCRRGTSLLKTSFYPRRNEYKMILNKTWLEFLERFLNIWNARLWNSFLVKATSGKSINLRHISVNLLESLYASYWN